MEVVKVEVMFEVVENKVWLMCCELDSIVVVVRLVNGFGGRWDFFVYMFKKELY